MTDTPPVVTLERRVEMFLRGHFVPLYPEDKPIGEMTPYEQGCFKQWSPLLTAFLYQMKQDPAADIERLEALVKDQQDQRHDLEATVASLNTDYERLLERELKKYKRAVINGIVCTCDQGDPDCIYYAINEHGNTKMAQLEREHAALKIENERLTLIINTPETNSFISAVIKEQEHQKLRWGVEHDKQREDEEWLWVLGYLAGKALRAMRDKDYEKALHHTISSAALCANWHERLLAGQECNDDGQCPKCAT